MQDVFGSDLWSGPSPTAHGSQREDPPTSSRLRTNSIPTPSGAKRPLHTLQRVAKRHFGSE